MAESSAEPVAGLYVHVPFCARKCLYCAFYSEPSTGEVIDRYVSALIRELERVAADLRPRTIFFGGGTLAPQPVPMGASLPRYGAASPVRHNRMDRRMQSGHLVARQS